MRPVAERSSESEDAVTSIKNCIGVSGDGLLQSLSIRLMRIEYAYSGRRLILHSLPYNMLALTR